MDTDDKMVLDENMYRPKAHVETMDDVYSSDKRPYDCDRKVEFANLIDMHTHSYHSPDSTTSMREMCGTAAKMQFKIFAVTDHFECDLVEEDNYVQRAASSFQEINELSQHYKDLVYPTKLLRGVELGQILQNKLAAQNVLRHDYDIVLGSLHRAPGMPDYCFIDYKNYGESDLDRLLREYYTELLATAQTNYFDVLCHLTYPLRYIVGDAKRQVDVTKCDDIIEEIFKVIIKNRIALEVNISGYRQAIGVPLPDAYYLKMYKKIGGKLITIGSDSHRAQDIGLHMKKGVKMIFDAGFRQITYYDKRIPMQETIY